jgi:hypothetical protein
MDITELYAVIFLQYQRLAPFYRLMLLGGVAPGGNPPPQPPQAILKAAAAGHSFLRFCCRPGAELS